MSNGVVKFLFLSAFFVAWNTRGYAQYNVQHQPPTVLNANATNTLEFMVPAVNPMDVADALLFYRNEGDLGYAQMELEYINGNFVANLLPEQLVGTSFEYYFQLSLLNYGQDIFYPDNVPAENPIKIDIVTSGEPEFGEYVEQREQAEGIEYTILSPKPGNALSPTDAYIAIALYYDVNQLKPGEFRLYINERDVTEDADTSAYFIAYKPSNLVRGEYTVTLDYVTENGPLEVVKWQFGIVKKGEASFQSFGPKMMPTGRIELTARNQIISGNTNNALTARSYITGGYKKFNYRLSGFLTSQESDRLQPQNRFALQMNLGKWWNFQAGHVYPTLGRFTISGRRIYGVNTSVHALWNTINVQFLYGELSRKVTNIYDTIETEDVLAGTEPDSVVDRNYTLTYGEAGRGTFTRKIIGGRIGLGNPKHFQLGVQAMKVEDDTTSIFNITDYTEVLNSPTFLMSNLTIADQQRLSAQPELLRVQGGSPAPKGNIVAGADLKIGIDDNKIRFQTETVASALNNDIYGGILDSLRAADLGFEDIDPKDLNILDEISRLIIINENMSVLPIRVTGLTNADSTEAEFFFPTAILGHNSELSLMYPKNNFSLQYRWVGPEFVSLANSTIRKDIAGFTALDRFRLLDNQVYITLGFESLVDNLANNKEATTTTNSIRSNVSWFPTDIQLPKISFGFRYRERDNGVKRFNPLVSQQFESASIQNIRIVDGDTLTTATPRLNSTLNVNFSITQQIPIESSVHDATLSISTLNTRDDVFAYGDIKNNAFSLSVTSRFSQMPLRTQLGMTVNNTASGSGQLDLTIFGTYLGGSYILLEGKLHINTRVAFTSNTTTSRLLTVQNGEDDSYLNDYYALSEEETISEFSTFVILAGAEYKFAENHSLVFNSNFTSVSGNNALNDRIVQLRYIYRF